VISRRALFERLDQAGRVAVVSAPAGSGKTVLLRSWIRESGLEESAAWVSAQRGERDAQRFWILVADALRATAPGSVLVRPLAAAPDLDGWAIAERLLKDLASLEDRIWLVVDDVHELGAAEALAQLELFLLRAPAELRFVLATREELRLGLHRLRLAGELTEIRAADLRFAPKEARLLFEAAGVELPDSALALLHERTEGWVAGLRLAALSLVGHPDPERFAAEFSGSERTVAEYLLAEVLDRQSEEVRRLLLRTSMLGRVNGELADLLTGGNGGERILQELEAANAFVVALDARRSWFRYHHLFADLLQLQLRRTAPGEITALHSLAADWFAGHGYPVAAIRHAQAAHAWGLAARLLADHWFGLDLDGRAATTHELLAGFPADAPAADAKLAALVAADELAHGSLEEAERYLALATLGSASVSTGRRGQVQVLLGVVGLLLARQRGNLPAVVEEARRLRDMAEAPDAAQPGTGQELRALALINLGSAEVWAARFEDADRHLEHGVALAHRIGRPFLEVMGLAHWAVVPASAQSLTLGAQRSREAIELAERHGWSDELLPAVAYAVLAVILAWQGRLEEAEPCLWHAERTLRADLQPPAGPLLGHARGLLELARGRYEEALDAFQAAGRLAGQSVTPHYLVTMGRALLLHTLVRLGEIKRVEAALAGMAEQERATGEMRTVLAALQLAQGDPRAAATALGPVPDGSASVGNPGIWLTWAFLLEAAARDALGEAAAAGQALERALDAAEPDGALLPFLLDPAPGLLERHARDGTAHAALIAQILDLLAGQRRAPPPGAPERLREPLTGSEIRVLRYLPTNRTAPEIAGQLSLSVNTVKMHMRHLYAKLDVHYRSQAVERARALGLLAPSPHRR
jgi:LuxR family transcriptional regulator, maltose regulon positive regulatory protein